MKLSEKLCKIKVQFEEDEEDEYDNFYNRINLYFSNIVTELKLLYMDSSKIFQEKEFEYQRKIQVIELNKELEAKLMKDTQEKEEIIKSLRTKIGSLEAECISNKEKTELLSKTVANLLAQNKQNEEDISKLLLDKIISKIEHDILSVNLIKIRQR